MGFNSGFKELNTNLTMANVQAETCSWYCRYCLYHFC